jgi:Mg2+-importing ATPase
VFAAVVAAVVAAALHFTEGRDPLRLAERAQPGWLLAALLLQVGTYLAQGQVWRIVSGGPGSGEAGDSPGRDDCGRCE